MVRRFLLSHYNDSFSEFYGDMSSENTEFLGRMELLGIEDLETKKETIIDEGDTTDGGPEFCDVPEQKGDVMSLKEQSEMNLRITMDEDHEARIKVMGVGGAGSNAVDNMIRERLEGVDFIAVNTDMQALDASRAKVKCQIGRDATRGLGAGGNPDMGKVSADESKQILGEYLENTDMLFITAGMGGGTGTGAAPVIAEIAKDKKILTVGVVSKPFFEEGKKRIRRAKQGIEELKKHVDTLIVIPNDQLFELIDDDTTFEDAFRKADDVLYQATKGVSDIINTRGYVNLDFADAKAVMSNSGQAIMGIGVKEGKDRSQLAAEEAINSPLLGNLSIAGAKSILVNITGNDKLGMKEIKTALRYITEQAGDDADVYFGVVKDEEMGDAVSITVIATGFDSREKQDETKDSIPDFESLKSESGSTIKFASLDNNGNGSNGNGDGHKNGNGSVHKPKEFISVDMEEEPVVDYCPDDIGEKGVELNDPSLPPFLRMAKNKYPKLKRRRDNEF